MNLTKTNLAKLSEQAYAAMRLSMEAYAPISDLSWSRLKAICKLRRLGKLDVLYAAGEVPNSYAYVYSGLMRVSVSDEKGKQYNKNFFEEGSFPGAMAALLLSEASRFSIDALEASVLIEIDFAAYRILMVECDDLKLFQIYYLEKNWLIAKDNREIEIVQQDAAERYEGFLKEFPSLGSRLPQYHIASHLGISPTQLSRIRKNR